jgi:hypothetical protein
VIPSGNATSSATRHGDPTSTKLVVLKCAGDSGGFHVRPKPNNPDTVIFATSASCPLQGFKFDQTASGFSLIGTDSDGNFWYSYDGTPIAAGYSFSYQTSEKVKTGNGTGVIKN